MRVPIVLYLVALGVRALAGILHADPAYPDSTYYVAVAHSLAAGHGFTVDFVWNFVDVGGRLPADPMLPIPSNAHWMPLASLVQVPFLWLFGDSALAGFIPFALIGATAAPLTWAIARDAGLSEAQAIAAALMTAIPGAVAPFLSQPDNFALFMPLGALALWLCARGLRGDTRAFVLGGLVVGLATLARNDGVLLAIPFAVGWLRQRWIGRGSGADEPVSRGPARLSLAAAVACGALFLLVMGPWYARQLAVFGSLSPSASSGRILWITSYSSLFSVTGDPNLGSFLAQGWEPLVRSRLGGLITALALLAAEPFLIFLAPFVILAGWFRRHSGHFGPWFVYAGSLLLASALLFAVHVPYGTFLHSAVALIPHGYVLGVEGIGLAVAWAAARRRHWVVPRATRTFTAIAVATLWVGGAVGMWKAVGDWGSEAERRRAVAADLADVAGPDDRLMSADPGAYRYFTGLGGVVTPQDPLDTVEAVARAYDIQWLVLEPAHIVVSLAQVYRGNVPLPGWLVQVDEAASSGPPGETRTDGQAAEPAFRIYAVCLSAADPRSVCHTSQP